MSVTDEERNILKDENLRLDAVLKALKTDDLEHRIAKRRDVEFEQLLADIRLKNRQQTTEVWQVVLLTVGVTAASVQAINVIFGG